MKKIIHISLLVVILVSLCACGSQKTFLNNSKQGEELFFLYNESSLVKVKLNTKDNTFKYTYGALDVHFYAVGHWKIKKNILVLGCDIKPSFERWAEGWLYEDKLLFEIKDNTLVYKQHIYPHGISDFPEDIILKPITKDEYDSIP